MAEELRHQLSRRESQIMDAVYRLGRGSVNEIRDEMPDPPSYSAVRAQLRILEEKGFLTHEADGPRYLYLPTRAKEEVRRTALRHLLGTFFAGSTSAALATLLDLGKDDLSDEELDRLSMLIDRAREGE
jgi:BlaI family transcriptional regulator, penicillinase repressor